MRWIKFLLIALPLLQPIAINAAPTNTVSRDESPVLLEHQAIALAIKENPSLNQMRQRYAALSKIPSQRGTLADPVISFGAMNYPSDTFDRGQEPMTQLQIGVSQSFPFPGKLGLRQEAAEFEAKAAHYAVEDMRLMLASSVSNKWWQVFYLDRALNTIELNQKLIRQFIEVAKIKYTTGKGLQQDVLLSQLELSKLIDQQIQVNALRDNQAIMLNILMNQKPRDLVKLPKNLSNNPAKLRTESALYRLAESSNPVLDQRRQSVLAANSRLNLAKRDYYPDFKVALTYGDRIGNNPLPMGGSRSDLLSLMVGVKIPLYAGSKQSQAVKQRALEKMKFRYALLDQQNQVMADIATSITNYQRAQLQLSLFETGILPQARQTVQSMLAGYQVSQVDFLNLIRSQMTLFNYELQYWKSVTESNQALARLQASVGKESIYE